MSVKRWTEGVDHESKCEFTIESAAGMAMDARNRRRKRGTRIGSIDHVDLVMDTWATDLPCAVCCKAKWSCAIYVRLNANLLAFPVCKSKACKETLRKDAIAENPNIN